MRNNILDHIEDEKFVNNFENFVKIVPRELSVQTKQDILARFPTHAKTQDLLNVLAKYGI